MIVYGILSVARQVEGDLMLVQSEKSYVDKSLAEAALKSKPQQSIDMVKTDVGDVKCHIVRGIFEIDVVDLDVILAAKNREEDVRTT